MSLYQLTQHFERSTKSASRRGSSTYSSWFNPTKKLSMEDLPTVVKDSIETDDGTMSTEYKQFLKVYAGKLMGLQEASRALDQWPTQKKSAPLNKSCQTLLTLIEALTPILWDLGTSTSRFHIQREKLGIPWDDSSYWDVYKSVQRVTNQIRQNAMDITSKDKGYAAIC